MHYSWQLSIQSNEASKNEAFNQRILKKESRGKIKILMCLLIFVIEINQFFGANEYRTYILLVLTWVTIHTFPIIEARIKIKKLSKLVMKKRKSKSRKKIKTRQHRNSSIASWTILLRGHWIDKGFYYISFVVATTIYSFIYHDYDGRHDHNELQHLSFFDTSCYSYSYIINYTWCFLTLWKDIKSMSMSNRDVVGISAVDVTTTNITNTNQQ